LEKDVLLKEETFIFSSVEIDATTEHPSTDVLQAVGNMTLIPDNKPPVSSVIIFTLKINVCIYS
jgi:hypothetical protein